MKINKAYKFRLEPNAEQELVLNKLLGSARFVWIQTYVKQKTGVHLKRIFCQIWNIKDITSLIMLDI
jgi:transposase